jgi:hypothetical protein
MSNLLIFNIYPVFSKGRFTQFETIQYGVQDAAADHVLRWGVELERLAASYDYRDDYRSRTECFD